MSNRVSYGNFKAEGISPKSENPKDISSVDELNTVGLVLSKENSRDLIECLQKAIDDKKIDKINITGFRNTNQVTVTAYVPVKKRV
jgi:hypothetical protein